MLCITFFSIIIICFLAESDSKTPVDHQRSDSVQRKGPPPPVPGKKNSIKGRPAQLSQVKEEPGGKDESTTEKKPVGKLSGNCNSNQIQAS